MSGRMMLLKSSMLSHRSTEACQRLLESYKRDHVEAKKQVYLFEEDFYLEAQDREDIREVLHEYYISWHNIGYLEKYIAERKD
jgi:hypothetical protein